MAFGSYFGNFGDTVSKLGQIAEEVGSQIDGGLQNVALNIGQAIRSGGGGGVSAGGGPAGGPDRSGGARRSPSSSSVSSPEEVSKGGIYTHLPDSRKRKPVSCLCSGGVAHLAACLIFPPISVSLSLCNPYSSDEFKAIANSQLTDQARINTRLFSFSIQILSSSSSGSSFHHDLMGSGGLSGTSTGGSNPRHQQHYHQPQATTGRGGSSSNSSASAAAAAMVCDNCGTKLSFFKGKKSCSECQNEFCRACVNDTFSSVTLASSNKSVKMCGRCKILVQRPPVRTQLMQLRVKDLQRYLVSKRVNTKACRGEKHLERLRNLRHLKQSLQRLQC